jgi:hypothetical protein
MPRTLSDEQVSILFEAVLIDGASRKIALENLLLEILVRTPQELDNYLKQLLGSATQETQTKIDNLEVRKVEQQKELDDKLVAIADTSTALENK